MGVFAGSANASIYDDAGRLVHFTNLRRMTEMAWKMMDRNNWVLVPLSILSIIIVTSNLYLVRFNLCST